MKVYNTGGCQLSAFSGVVLVFAENKVALGVQIAPIFLLEHLVFSRVENQVA